MSPMKSIAAVLLLALLFACGSSDPKSLISEGNAALGSSDFKTAQSKFTEALKTLKPGDAQYIDAKLGLVEALIPDAPNKSNEEFLALSAAFPAKVGEKEFVHVSGLMVSARKYIEAIALITAGIKRAGGESPQLMLQIERIKKEAINDKAVNDALKGLGYIK